MSRLKIYDYFQSLHRGGFRRGERGGLGQASNSPFVRQAKRKKMRKVLNIMAKIKANFLDGYLIVISSFWHCYYF